MSSHREAPEISKDPSADNTDVYAFVSPDKPDTVTLIANFNPFELPYGGPNFNEFAADVQYDINISNRGTARADITYRFNFHVDIRNKNTFLYNTGPISSPTDTTWNRPQTYDVTRIDNDRNGNVTGRNVLATGLYSPPVNVGVHSTPDYPDLAKQAYYDLGGNLMVFAGQRADGFHVDLGSVFDLGDLRPFQKFYAISPMLANMDGVNGLRGLNVHTLAIQVPMTELTVDGQRPTDVNSSQSVIGVYASASRATNRQLLPGTGRYKNMGGFSQISRLAIPLNNELLNPMAVKDRWNASAPHNDRDFAEYVLHPELAKLISTVLYPAAFPRLARYVRANKPRNDLAAIILTGIPTGVIPGFQNYTGPVLADLQRLNMAIPPTKPNMISKNGLLGGDLAGFPNGRRPIDDVTGIDLKAVAGATIPLVDPSYTPDHAATILNDGTNPDNTPYGAPYLKHFPYLSNPNNGFTSMPGTPGGDQVRNA